MITILNKSGAFLYDCTEEQADKRIKEMVAKKTRESMSEKAHSSNGTLDYDEKGNLRSKEGMCGWLFTTPTLMEKLIAMDCEAVYVESLEYKKFRKADISNVLAEAYKNLFATSI